MEKHCCGLATGQNTFSKIFQMYINKYKRPGVSVVAFDGYKASTKDMTQNVRSGNSQVVKIIAENSCPFDRAEYLTNYANKQIFVNELTGALELERFQTVLCPSNANTTTVRKALEAPGEQVTILADDTDLFCLLLHHLFFSNSEKKILLKNMRFESSKDERICCNIQDVIATNPKEHIEHLLFAHVFNGSDTTSQIQNFGKKLVLKSLLASRKFPKSFTQTILQLVK